MNTIGKSAEFCCRICGYPLHETDRINEYLCSGCGSKAKTYYVDGELYMIYTAPERIPEKKKEQEIA